MAKTYSERRADRQARLDGKAAKLASEFQALHARARAITAHIPFGQPILVGHHSERRHRSDLAKSWRLHGKAFEVLREHERVRSVRATSAILAGDADAVERLREEIAKGEAAQARMKAANLCIRKGNRAGLLALGFSEADAAKLFQPDFCGRVGFADYALSNNNANVRRLKLRLASLEAAKAAPAIEREIKGVSVVEDPEAMRLRLVFPGKPAPAVIADLKASGFRWAPSEGAWQRQLNNAARWAADQVLAKLAQAAE